MHRIIYNPNDNKKKKKIKLVQITLFLGLLSKYLLSTPWRQWCLSTFGSSFQVSVNWILWYVLLTISNLSLSPSLYLFLLHLSFVFFLQYMYLLVSCRDRCPCLINTFKGKLQRWSNNSKTRSICYYSLFRKLDSLRLVNVRPLNWSLD